MKSITKWALITIIVLHEVQGQNDKRILESEEKWNTTSSNYVQHKNKKIVGRFMSPPALKRQTKRVAPENLKNFKMFQGKRKSLKSAKIYDNEILYNNNDVAHNKSPVKRNFPTQRIYCRQITKSEVNDQGKTIESIQHICAPLQAATRAPSTTVKPNIEEQENNSQPVTTTPKGINCRPVMNSWLNDLGEIIDSVTEVCDPPPTTTTTTRKPIVYTWPTTSTTTPKPLVKVCRPVMDSYLNEEGKIIDSVSIYCKMEQVN